MATMQASEHAYAVILAGGGGTRLWPKSRKKTPKHLLILFDNESMLQTTYRRILPLIPKERVFVITLEKYVDDVLNQIPDLPRNNIIAEPQSKNTALAMGVASTYIYKQDEDAVVINLAADQVIDDEDRFLKTAQLALEVASNPEYIVAIGIRPTFPHTGVGYMKIGKELDERKLVFESRGFKEKPDLVTAQSFLASGQYLWNANLYCWSAKAISQAFEIYAPTTHDLLAQLLSSIGTKDEEITLEKIYEEAENVQIDYAISEKIDNLVIVPGNFGWSDVGDWKVIYDTHKKDSQGNVVVNKDEEYLNIESRNCLIESNGRLVVTIGLDNIVIVDTPDALLICHKDRTQDVKKAVEKLKEEQKEEYL